MTADPSRLTSRERVALLEEPFQDLAARFPEGRVLVGGEEASLLWEATVDSFTQGVWVATLLCAQATCERTLAGLISLRELPAAGTTAPKGWDRGLGSILKYVREQKLVPPNLLAEVAVLCEARKPYGHWRLPFEPGTIGREVANVLRAEGFDADPAEVRQRILSQKALHAATTTLLLYFGDYGRGPYEPPSG